MRQTMLAICLLIMVAERATAQEKDLQTFAWLTGVWETTQGARRVEEQWTAPTSNTMLGLSRTVIGGKTAEFEFLRIEKRGAEIFYVPQPGGRPPVSFKLTSSDAGTYIFENTTGDDRVKRIEYRREGEDGLYARVEGAQSGKPFVLEFRYRRRK
jgi:hypothetical protein